MKWALAITTIAYLAVAAIVLVVVLAFASDSGPMTATTFFEAVAFALFWPVTFLVAYVS